MTPEQLAQAQEIDSDGYGRWSLSNMLAAALLDEARIANYYTLSINSEKGKGPKKPPEPVSRPGVEKSKPRVINPDARAYLEKLRASRGAKNADEWQEVDRGAA